MSKIPEKIKRLIDSSKATAFEKKVYMAAASIPRGQVRSYKWVAERAGSPKAFRAVGQALNKNPLAPMVPCHRVINSDGALGGFAGGMKAKMRLLKEEKQSKFK